MLNALDGRNKTSVQEGTGGLLQTASYLAGLSRGSWLLTSLVQADFPTLPSLIFGLDSIPGDADPFGGWLTQFGTLQVSSSTTAEDDFIGLLLSEIAGKRTAGFPVTIADAWTRALARHFANGTTAANFLDPNVTHGAGLTFSGVSTM